MKSNIKQLPKNTVLLIITVALLGMLAGSGITYLALQSIPNRNNSIAPNLNDPNVKKSLNFEERIPEGTVSPTTVANDPKNYDGKEVKMRGRIIKVAQNKYIITGQEKENVAAINLDLSKTNVDIEKYLSGYASTDEFNNKPQKATTASAVTATGKFSSSQSFVLTVQNIE